MKKWVVRSGLGIAVIGVLALTVSADFLGLGGLVGGLVEKGVKIVGMDVLVRTQGKHINEAINKLSHHKDTWESTTKVVPILSVGLGARSAVGAAQIIGPKDRVEQVVAVAQPELGIFGDQVRIRALIPVSSKNFTHIKKVEGVGVSGIADLKL